MRSSYSSDMKSYSSGKSGETTLKRFRILNLYGWLKARKVNKK